MGGGGAAESAPLNSALGPGASKACGGRFMRSAPWLRPLLAAALLLLPGVSRAATFTLQGVLSWTDGAGHLHPVRLSDVNLWDDDVGPDELVSSGSTGLTGAYGFIGIDNNDGALQGNRDPYLEVFANGAAHFVSSDGTVANTYTGTTAPIAEIPDGTTNQNYASGNTTNTDWAFSVSDAVTTGTLFATAVRGVPTSVAVRFPAAGTFYCATGAEAGCNGIAHELNVVSGDRWDWDVILHEYGHHLAAIDGLDNSPGGTHNTGISNIGINGHTKQEGVQLGWSEGLATYLSIAAQDVTRDLGYLDTSANKVPNTGDTFYSDTIDNVGSYDVEGDYHSAGRTPHGEGDELAVMRILYDIADPDNEGHDHIGIGHDALYDILNTKIANLDQLDDLWDYFFANPDDLGLGAGVENDEARAVLGEIFEKYSVAPDPIAGWDADPSLDLNGGPLIVSWDRGNDDRNDTFVIYFFDEDFSTQIFVGGIAVPGDVDTYELTVAQWDALRAHGEGNYNLVVAGSDTTSYTTGSYWSGAKAFSLVPEPARLVLLACTLFVPGLERRWARRKRM
jgi:hypothetical protein